MFRLVATRTSLSYDWDYAQFNVEIESIHLCKLKCELRPQHATPPSRIRLPRFACRHNFSSAPRTLIANFLCQLHSLNAPPPPLFLSLPCYLLWKLYLHNFQHCSNNLRASSAASSLYKLLTTSTLPLPLGHTPFVFAQRVCNLCEYKKNCQVSRKLTETKKLRAFHPAYELRERSKYLNFVEIKQVSIHTL